MKKSEPPHILSVQVGIADKSICGKCSCVAGASGYCHHVVGLLFYMSHCKHLGLKSLPDQLTCTSLPQMWSVPRQKKIANKAIQDVMVKKPQAGADYTKFVKSTLYSPTTAYPLMHSEIMTSLKPQPLMATVLPPASKMTSISPVATSFGNAAQGSVLSYQQKLSKEYIINDYSCTFFPDLPLETAVERFTNNVPVCLSAEKQAALDSLGVTRDTAIKLEQQTISQSNNETWYHLREKRITASKFGKVAKRKTNFESLVTQLNPSRRVVTADMQRGIDMEPVAAMAYANIAKQGKVNLFPSGLIINPRSPWLGCSPDRKVYDSSAEENGYLPFGLFETKVVKEGSTDFDGVPYIYKNPVTKQLSLKRNHEYYYQVQCQLGLSGLEWNDFFSYINETTFFCERIYYDADFFQIAKDNVDAFFFNFYLK